MSDIESAVIEAALEWQLAWQACDTRCGAHVRRVHEAEVALGVATRALLLDLDGTVLPVVDVRPLPFPTGAP